MNWNILSTDDKRNLLKKQVEVKSTHEGLLIVHLASSRVFELKTAELKFAMFSDPMDQTDRANLITDIVNYDFNWLTNPYIMFINGTNLAKPYDVICPIIQNNNFT